MQTRAETWFVLSAVIALTVVGAGYALTNTAVAPGIAERRTAAHHHVEAHGKDMQWQFFEIVAADELHRCQRRPLGSELRVQPGDRVDVDVTSADYIYVLTLPDGQRQIGIPDMIHRVSFSADQPGVFELRADPMCGLRFFHDEVQGIIRVTVDAETDIQDASRTFVPG